MKQRLLELIPEFKLISDSKLRELTIAVWQEAIKKRGWEIEDLRQMPFTLLIKNIDVNIIEHTRAVTLVSLRIAEVLEKVYMGKVAINRDYLLAGAILHDVGKLFEYKKEQGKFAKSHEGELLRHPISGAAFAFKFGLPQEVIHIIASHSKEGEGARRTIEAVIINHADFVNFDIFRE